MKRSLEFKIYIGVPRVRNAMPPPPYPRQYPRGGASMPACVFARRKGHIALSSGMDAGHTSTCTRQRHGNTSGRDTNLLCASEVISPRPISMQFLVLFLCDPLEIGTVVVRANAVFMVYNIAVFVMRDKRPRNKQMNVNRPCFSVFCKSNLIISVYVYGWSQCVCFPCLLVDYYPCARILNQCCRQSFNSSKV